MKGLSRPELSKAVQDVDAMRGGRPVAGEIFDDACSPEHFTQALKRLGSPPAIKRRLLVAFNSSERRQVEAFSKSIGDTWPHTAVGNLILLDGVDRRKRPAVLALRQGARAWLLDGEVVKVVGSFWYPRPEPTKGAKAAPVRSVDAHALEVRIRAYLPGASSLTIEPPQPSHWHSAASVSLETDSPAEALSALQKCGDEIGATTWLGVGEVDSLQMLLLRLQAELSR